MRGETAFIWALRATGVFIVLAGMMHVLFGLGADAMLGANVSASSLTDAGLDSQNRFYGAAFTLYGVLLIMVSRELTRYRPVLHALLGVFWLAGVARILSVVIHGWPPGLMLVLLGAELLLPPVLLFWSRRVARGS